MGARRASEGPSFGRLTAAAMLAALASRGCNYAWDSYDPRLTGGAGGTGGSGGAPSSSSSSSSGTGGAPSSSSSSSSTSASSSSSSTSSSTSAGSSSTSSGTLCTPNMAESCYGGPPGTEANLPCKPGVRVCASDGMSWGSCLGAVTPITEDCGSASDDDCNGQANDHCALWSEGFGNGSAQKPYGLAVSPAGDIVITGQLFGSPNLGGGVVSSAGGGDLFVAKYTSDGGHVWSKAFGDTAIQLGYGAALDASGNVYVTGYFEGTMTIGSSTLTSAGLEDAFVAKIDASGTPLWAVRFGGAGTDTGYAIAVGPNGHAWVTGSFEGTVNFGAGAQTASSLDGFIVEIDASGVVVQSRVFGGSGNDEGRAVAVDASGNALVAGYFDSSATFGATTLTAAGGVDGFVVKLSPAGAPQWAKAFGSSNDEVITAVAADSGGNVIVGGMFAGQLNFGCGAIPNQGPTDILIAKLSPSGTCVWAHGYGDPAGGQQDVALAVDGLDNVIFTDEYLGTMDFGGYPVVTPLNVNEAHDVLLVKLDASGKHVFSRRFGDGSDQDGRAVRADGMNNIYLLVELGGGLDMGNGVIASAGSDDIVLAKLSP